MPAVTRLDYAIPANTLSAAGYAIGWSIYFADVGLTAVTTSEAFRHSQPR